ncbi:MAG: hypothetical protein LBN05_07965 [Oscillospiraceae bacterium]|jgi:hypothetical protein|nr:hypothetical protein [Oscillospiraceae bacterium]
MPNNITNKLNIICDEERRREILEAIKLEKHGLGSIDFEKIIPMPEDIFRGDITFGDFQNRPTDNWYDWSIANWGTKWNSYGYEDFTDYDGGSEIQFHTAWSSPEPVMQRLSEMYPDVQFQHQWADEDIGHNVGEITYEGGEQVAYDVPTGGSKEAYEMAAEILEMPLSEFGLYYSEDTGSYVYHEQEKQLPDCPLIGADGNIFNVMGIATRTLKDNGLRAEAAEMRERVTTSGNYDEALGIIMECVTPVSVGGEEDLDEDQGMTM